MSRRLHFRMAQILRIRRQEEKLMGERLAEKIQAYHLLSVKKADIIQAEKDAYVDTNQVGTLAVHQLQQYTQYLQALKFQQGQIQERQALLQKKIIQRQAQYAQIRSKVKALEGFRDRWYQEQKKELHKIEQRSIDDLALHKWRLEA